ncbi:MAG: MurR/RpiR family transcriptional regulator [Lachnospiraceae bacterium]|nr:MurR/RpiR family transcriptional regulator [Lachnospiraceae bacterium]
MEKHQSVLDTIHILYDSFFEQEKKIAKYIIENHKEVVNMTISELAAESKTSVATISRFCKKCGVDGFHHLKIGLAKEIVESDATLPVSNTISRNEIDQSLQNILANKIEELKQTVSLIDADNLNQILECIKNAGCVQFAAVGNTIPVALDGAFKLNQIGIKATAGAIWEAQLAHTLNLKRGDVLIAISNSGESRQVVKMVQAAKEQQVTTIGITNNVSSSVGSIVDYHIQTATREKLFLNEFCFSRVSAMTVMEILYLFLTVGEKKSYEKVRKCEDLMADEKL